MKVSSEISQKIRNMGLLCAALVVLIHSGIPAEHGSLAWFFNQLMGGGIAGIAVPFFFLISGFFLAAHTDKQGWWKHEVGKRVSSLVVPFFIWSFICVICSIPLSFASDLKAHLALGSHFSAFIERNWLRIPGVDLTEYPILAQLWYVRCLFFFVLAAPFIVGGVLRFRYVWLVGCLLVSILQIYVPEQHLKNVLRFLGFSNGIFYFSLGIFINKNKLTRPADAHAVVCLIVGLSLLAVKTIFSYNASALQEPVCKLALPFLLIAVWHFMPSTPLPAGLTSCAFPVFLMHPIIISNCAAVLRNVSICPRGLMTLTGINFAVGIFGSVVCACLIRRFLPRAAEILFGGR